MGLFSSKKKTTYYSNHIRIVKMDKQFKPYINALVMSTSLRTDRYTSATDVLKDGIFNSPKLGLSKLFKYQAKTLGRQGELYAPAGDLYNFDYYPYLKLSGSEYYEVIDVTEGFLEVDYYVMDWVIKNRPELMVFQDDFQIEYLPSTKSATLEINSEKLSIPLTNIDPNTRTLYMLYKVKRRDNPAENTKEELVSSEELEDFYIPKGYSEVSSKTYNNEITNETETTVSIDTTGEELKKEVTYKVESIPTKERVYETRDVTQEEYSKGIIGKKITIKEIIQFTEETSSKRSVEYYEEGGRFKTRAITTKTVTQKYHKKVIQTNSQYILSTDAYERYGVFIYRIGSGYTAIDNLVNTRKSLGFKIRPLIVKRWESLVSPTNMKDQYDFNNRCIKKFSSSTSDYSQMYKSFSSDGLPDIKESILLFGVSLDLNEQFAIEYCYKFFSYILDFYNRREGSVNVNEICKQSAGNLYYDSGVGSASRKKYTGVYNASYKIGRVYKTAGTSGGSGGFFGRRNKPTINYIVRTSPVTYEIVTIELMGQSAMSSTHWMSHGIDGASGDNQNAGAIIPLLEGVIRAMPVKYVADVAKYSMSVLMTTYQTVKIKWYQRSIFKVVVAIVMIAVSIFFPPVGGAAAAVAGTIGATVATYMALSGIAYLVVAYAVNAVIGMVVAKIVTSVVGKFIGGHLGQLISTVITTVAMQSFQTGQSLGSTFSSMFKDMFSMSRLLDLSNLNKAIGYGANKYLKKKMEKLEEIQKRIDDMKEQLKDVKEKTEELYAKSGIMDTRYLLDAISDDLPSDIMATAEMPDTFINRATLKGSEIADMTLSTIYDFVEIELSTKNFIPSYE